MAPGDRPRTGPSGRADVPGAADRRGPGRSESQRRERGERRTARHVRPRRSRIHAAPERAVLLPASAETAFAPEAPGDREETGRGPPRDLRSRTLCDGGCLVPAAPEGAPVVPRLVPSACVRGVRFAVRRRGQRSDFPIRVSRGLYTARVTLTRPPGVGEGRERTH